MMISPATLQLFFGAIFLLLIALRIFGAVKNTVAARRDNERLARLESRLEAIERRLNLDDSASANAATPSPWDTPTASTRAVDFSDFPTGDNLEEVRRLVRDNRKIEAIKLLRQNSDLDLRSAKDAVEEIARRP